MQRNDDEQGYADRAMIHVQKRDHRAMEVESPLFVFSPQGGQWPGMTRALLDEERAFREPFESCDRLVQAELGWSIEAALARDDAGVALGHDRDVQPTITAIQIALVELWRSWGIRPVAVAGMSLGEVGAAYAARVLGLEDAMKVSCTISRLSDRSGGAGGMMVVRLASDEVRKRLRSASSSVWLAAELSLQMTVVAGERASLEVLALDWKHDGTTVYPVSVGAAYHGEAMDEAREEFLASLTGLQVVPEALPFYSSVTGGRTRVTELGAEHWWRVVSRPARFVTLARELIRLGYRTFLEIGPHPILMGTLDELCREARVDAGLLPSMVRGQPVSSVLHASRRALAAPGAPIISSREH